MTIERLGPYRIERQIGQGGMGAVYAAIHDETGEAAAVKVLTAIQGSNSSLRIRFETEVETLKTLKHPHIVQLYGYGEQDGHLFYAMELVEGKSLQDELRDGRSFQPREVVRIGAEVAAALKHAHDHGVIHRDLKPANLLLTPTGQIKLADFGIAKLFGASQVTIAGGIVGTADYMSPEQADGLPITTRSDFYSLGCVLYALLARRPPFTGRSIAQVIHSLKFETPIQLRRLAPETPAELEDLIHQLLEKDPQARISTALVLGNRLKAIEHGLAHLEKNKSAPSSTDDDEYQLADDPHSGSPTRTLPHEKSTRVATDANAVVAQAIGTDATKIYTSPNERAATGGTQRPASDGSLFASSISRFTTVTEEELSRSRAAADEHRTDLTLWPKVIAAGMIGALTLWLMWSALQPASATVIYQRFAGFGLAGDFVQLETQESSLREFLTNYPTDSRVAQVQDWLTEIERQRKTRQLGRGVRRLNNLESLNVVQRAYYEANELAATNPDLAIVKLRALLAVFGSSAASLEEECQETLELARGQLDRLERASEKLRSANLELTRRQLERATELDATDRDSANAIRQGIIELFSDKPWANELVESAKQGLSATERGK